MKIHCHSMTPTYACGDGIAKTPVRHAAICAGTGPPPLNLSACRRRAHARSYKAATLQTGRLPVCPSPTVTCLALSRCHPARYHRHSGPRRFLCGSEPVRRTSTTDVLAGHDPDQHVLSKTRPARRPRFEIAGKAARRGCDEHGDAGQRRSKRAKR